MIIGAIAMEILVTQWQLFLNVGTLIGMPLYPGPLPTAVLFRIRLHKLFLSSKFIQIIVNRSLYRDTSLTRDIDLYKEIQISTTLQISIQRRSLHQYISIHMMFASLRDTRTMGIQTAKSHTNQVNKAKIRVSLTYRNSASFKGYTTYSFFAGAQG